MSKKLNKVFITSLTILVVSLVASFLKTLVDDYFKDDNIYKSVLIGMGLMVAVYYPMTILLNKYFTKLSQGYLRKSKKIAKSSTLGVIIGFLIAIFVLFVCYSYVWYDTNILADIMNKIK